MKSLPGYLVITGTVYFAATLTLAITQAFFGTGLFFACAAGATLAYALMLARIWNEDRAPRRLLAAAFLIAVAVRLPLVVPHTGPDSDLMRYLWDGRVQTLGYNPYRVVPADPALAATHTDDTRTMPSRRARTPYPPAAQLFFRLVVSLRDSPRAMKGALLLCDLLTIVVLWRWLALIGRNQWLALAYAWNPLVVFEIAYSAHIDALGALWVVASAYWLARRRTLLASIAFVLAVATKLLPIVLLPLYWRRVRARDALGGALLMVLLYLPFMSDGRLPFGDVPNVVAHIRFNGPLFRFLAGLSTPQAAAGAAVAFGLGAAALARWRLEADNPAAWAWPMGIALAGAPVIYPWYLLYLTPFLFTLATLPLVAWTVSVIPVYVVWQMAREGHRWVTPASIMIAEFSIPLAVASGIAWWVATSPARSRNPPASPAENGRGFF